MFLFIHPIESMCTRIHLIDVYIEEYIEFFVVYKILRFQPSALLVARSIWFHNKFGFPIGTDNEKEKFSGLPPSSHGSLSSITATSIASSEDPRGGNGGDRGSAGFDGKGFDRKPSKVTQQPIMQEEWWKTTLQVSIPFFIAGLGTIGAGLILGKVEVSIPLLNWIELISRCQNIRWNNASTFDCYLFLGTVFSATAIGPENKSSNTQ